MTSQGSTGGFPFSVGGKIVHVKKSTGHMLTLMFKTNLPLRKFSRNPRNTTVLYTVAPLGPRHDYPYDWYGSAPYLFTTRHIEKAEVAGYVETSDKLTWTLTSLGVETARVCSYLWEGEFDQFFSGRGVDWKEMSTWI